MRTIAWFSSGAASAVMTKIALSDDPSVLPVQCDLGDSEDEDNRRFAADCEAWFGKPVHRIKSKRYADIDEVFEARKYHAGIAGAPCTGEMKVAPRLDFQLPSDVHLWGYTADKADVLRFERMRDTYPDMRQRAPLVERGITREMCFALLASAEIKRPRVYDFGWANGNCIGCVKMTSPGGWALTREFFPKVFARRAEQSRRFGSKLLRIAGERKYLDELPNDYPVPARAEVPRCDFLCQLVEQDMAA